MLRSAGSTAALAHRSLMPMPYCSGRDDVPRAEEVALLGAVAGDLAHAVRLALLRADAEAAAHPDAPGLVLLRPDGRLSAVSGLAQQWLSLLAPDGRLPRPSRRCLLRFARPRQVPAPRASSSPTVEGWPCTPPTSTTRAEH